MLFKRAPRTCLEDDLLLLLRRRAYDLAASARGCRVLLDGTPLAVRSFEDYVGLFLAKETFRCVQRCNERWDVALALTDGSGFRQVSFVNSICTSRGGTHVNYVAEQVVARILEELPRMDKASLSWLESRYSFQSAVFAGRMTSIIQFLGVLSLEIGSFRRPSHEFRVFKPGGTFGREASACEEPPLDLRELPHRESRPWALVLSLSLDLQKPF